MQIRHFLLLALFFVSTYSFAQKPEENIYNYDLVYMKDNSILKGEIIIFEEEDGDITFKDLKGKTYSITRDEYRYFKENVRYYEGDDRKIRIIKNRKINEFEVSVGFLPALTLFENVSPILASDVRNADFGVYGNVLPLSVSLAMGKYFNRNHFVGVNGSYGVVYSSADLNSYLSGGLKYKYQYDPYKNNLALYVLGTANYTSVQGKFRDVNIYGVDNDYVEVIDNTYKIQYPEIGVGHGFSWILKNKKSISLELSVSRALTLNETVQTANTLILIDANRSFSTAILGITFNL